MKKKKERAKQYEPLVKTNLSFNELLKISAYMPPEKDKQKIKIKKELKNGKRRKKQQREISVR